MTKTETTRTEKEECPICLSVLINLSHVSCNKPYFCSNLRCTNRKLERKNHHFQINNKGLLMCEKCGYEPNMSKL